MDAMAPDIDNVLSNDAKPKGFQSHLVMEEEFSEWESSTHYFDKGNKGWLVDNMDNWVLHLVICVFN